MRTLAAILTSAFCLLPSAFIPTAHAAVPQAQRDALIAIHDQTNGPQWTRRDGWLGAAGTECDWAGVQCDEAREHVIGLDLSDNNLAGPFPAAVRNLPRLLYLFLYDNRLAGAIPADVGSLSNLEALYAARNELTGPLPAALGSLSKLQYLGIDGNQIDGRIPRELGSLSALIELTLSYNKLTGPIPAEFSQLASLTLLSLDENQLDGSIPPELGRLAKLETLSLSVNKLTGSIPALLADATALVSVDLSYNQLQGGIPPALGGLRNLEQLDLSNNPLGGRIPKELGDLAKLRELELYVTGLQGEIPPELFRATALEVLALGDNGLTGNIPRDVASLANLRTLALYGNGFTGQIPIELTTLSKLTSLELQRNDLTGPIPSDISRLTELTGIDLSGNALSGSIPASLGALTRLEYLGLYENQLEGSIPPQLGDLTSLFTLYLASNRLTGTIPDTFRNLKRLRELSIAGNALTGSVPSWIGEMTALEGIFLGTNKLTGEIPSSVSALTNLVYLDIAENDLTGPLPDFTNLKALYYLRLSFNRLSGPLPASIGNATELDSVYIDNNRFTGPLPDLSRLTKLGTLAIQGNLFEGTLPTDLPESLVVLSVYGNRLAGPIPKEIGRLRNLQFLDLSWSGFRGPVPFEITQLTSLQDGANDFTYNGLFTDDPAVRQFLERKNYDRDWQGTQTVMPANVKVSATSDRSATIEWTPIAYTYDPGGYQVVASKTPGGAAAAIATTIGKDINSIILRNLEPLTTYFFTVATVTHPHQIQENLIVSDFTAPVSAATTARVLAPPDIAVTDSTTGLVQIGGVAANEDSFTLTNFGDGSADLSIARDGDFFTLEADAITIAGGASRTIKVRSVPQPVGSYYGGAYVIGEGASDGIYIPVVLLSVAKPAGTVVAEAVDTRIELAGVAGSDSVGTARFRNSGTAPLSGVVIADQPWLVPSTDPITIDPGQTANVNFRIVRSRRPPQTEGALTATLSLVYVDGSVLTALQTTTPSSGINISNVTIVDVTKPPVAPAQFGVAGSGEIALFIAGVASGLRGFGSDLSILNGSSSRSVSDLRLYFSLLGGTSSVATLQSLPSNQTVTLTNVVANVYNASQGTGTLQVRTAAGGNLAVLAKMTGLRNDGTFSGDMPVFRGDQAVVAQEKIYLAGLRPASDLLVQEVSGTATTVRIELLDANGAAVSAPQDSTVPGVGLLELRDVAANAVTAVITNLGGGRIVAYGRVTDSATGDTWSVVDWSRQNRYTLTEAMRVPLAYRAATSGGRGRRRAVHTDAVSQSSTTDLTLFNPRSSAEKVLIEVISANGRKSEREVAIAGLQTITLPNVVSTTDAATAHVVVTPLGRAQIVVTARSTRTAAPVVGSHEGLRVGQARSFAGLDDSTSATVAAASPATFTTSYGFVETSGEPVRVRARLFLDKERSVVTATVFRDFDLPALGQIVVPELLRSFAGETRDSAYGDLHNLRLQIEVIEGKGAVVPFVVVTDNGSGDTLMRMQ